MKNLCCVLILSLIFFSVKVFAENLSCKSQNEGSLYSNWGFVEVEAQVSEESVLKNVYLTATDSEKLGIRGQELNGVEKNAYLRFPSADAWCNYNLALPKDFLKRLKFVAFLDGYCEGGSRPTFVLDCQLTP